MGESREEWLRCVFLALVAKNHPTFSGLGLVLYRAPLTLPVLPLACDESSLHLPTKSRLDSINLMNEVCSLDSTFHDGFHLVDADLLCITHVSQFFAPPIPDTIPKPIHGHAIGARFMAAYLGSLMPTVSMTAILSKREGGLVFERGVIRSIIGAETHNV